MIPPVEFVTANKDYKRQRERPEGSNNPKVLAVEIYLNKCTTNAKDRRTKIRTYRTNVCEMGKLLQQNERYYDSGTKRRLGEDTAGRAKRPWLLNCSVLFATTQKLSGFC